MGLTRLCRAPTAVTVLVAELLAPAARANPTDGELQAARKLFVRAEQDEDGGRWSDALAKLRDVAQVKLTAGVRYHIALCEQNLGELANALDDYMTAENQSRAEDARDVLRLVGKRLEELRPRVPRLAVHVVPPRADAILTLDGNVLAASDAGVLVNPGPHRLDASAPDATPSSMVVTLHENEVAVVDVRLPTRPLSTPRRVPASAAGGSVSAPALPAESTTSRRGPAIVTTVAAAALGAGGVAAFLLAGSARQRGLTACAGVVSRAPDACDMQRNSVRVWDFAAAGLWAMTVAAGTVAVVLWAKPPGHSRGELGPLVGFGPGTIELNGQF